MSSKQDLARAHVLKGREIVQKQKERIARLERAGQRKELSKDLLSTFEETLRLFEADLERMENEAQVSAAK